MTGREIPVTDASSAADALATPPTDTMPAVTPPTDTMPAATPPTEVLRVPEAGEPPPRLADEIELIGEFADSGFRKAPFIARRCDGQMVQMPEMLYRLAEEIDGRAGYAELAESFSHAVQRHVTEANVRMLVQQRLRPLGIVAPDPGAEPVTLHRVDPLLALKFRAALVPDSAVRSLTTVFAPLFAAPVMVLVILGLAGLDVWLFFVHGISQSLRHTLYDPALMLLLIAGVILSTAFHEIGHATATRYGGAKPGVMGAGVYIVWPAFYTDITDAYRLSKWGRLRADIGGMYFNAVFALAVAGVYAATSFEPLLLLIVLQNFAIMQQALPLLRLDGYYILSDLTGVPDVFMRIRPILASLLPQRPADPRVAELKPWVRAVVSAYVLAIVVFLMLTGLALVINLPRILATGYSSAAAHFSAVGPAFSHAGAARGILDAVQGLFLILPALGLVFTLARVARRAGTLTLTWSAGHRGRQVTLVTAGAAGLAVAALSWWPNGEYRPIQPGERGTIGGLFGQLGQLPSARPSLTRQRALSLGLRPDGSAGRLGHGTRSETTGSGSTSSAGGPGTLGARLKIHRHTVTRPSSPGGSSLTATAATHSATTTTTSSSATTPAPGGAITPTTATSPTAAPPTGSGAAPSTTTSTTAAAPAQTTTAPASAPAAATQTSSTPASETSTTSGR